MIRRVIVAVCLLANTSPLRHQGQRACPRDRTEAS
jgi:hypothetical protein